MASPPQRINVIDSPALPPTTAWIARQILFIFLWPLIDAITDLVLVIQVQPTIKAANLSGKMWIPPTIEIMYIVAFSFTFSVGLLGLISTIVSAKRFEGTLVEFLYKESKHQWDTTTPPGKRKLLICFFEDVLNFPFAFLYGRSTVGVDVAAGVVLAISLFASGLSLVRFSILIQWNRKQTVVFFDEKRWLITHRIIGVFFGMVTASVTGYRLSAQACRLDSISKYDY